MEPPTAHIDVHQLAEEVTEKIWNQGKVHRLGDYYADDVVRHVAETSEPVVGLDANREYIAGLLRAFPDMKVTMQTIVAEHEWTAVRYTWTGTHRGAMEGVPATGKRVTMTGQSFLHIVNGKAVEIWDEGNILSMLQQLGVIPARS